MTTETLPTLETERLLLRRYSVDDFENYAAMWADPVVTKFIGGQPFSREQSWTRFLRQQGVWAVFGFGFFVVEEKATGAFLGEAGFHDLKRELTPSLEGTLETGWGFLPKAHGKGIATEVVGAVLAWGDKNFPGIRQTCLIDPENTASRRVAGKHGFREFARTSYHDKPTILFERPAS
jgi:RimJ/RimL family protein N-acetyltransferase